jgi:hypothetical protein
MRLKIELDPETTERLVASAVAECRPIPMQAEVLLRRALNLPFPYPDRGKRPDPAVAAGEPH